MGSKGATSSSRERLANRYAAWAAQRAGGVTAFVSQPEPRSIGLYARGKQLVSGNILLAGHLVEAPDALIWDIDPPAAEFADEAQGFSWLDDLAAVGTPQARRLAQSWTQAWIVRFGEGEGPGWTPNLTGRRLIGWFHHAAFLMAGQDRAVHDAFFLSLARQTHFLGRRARAAQAGLPRFEALIGLLYAGLSLQGLDRHAAPATKALAAECAREIDETGGIASRNPEELAEVLTLLSWATRALSEAGKAIPSDISDAIDRIAPCLRLLRHADGGLPRLHGGGRGIDGRLEQALTASAMPRPPGHGGMAMGFARLATGRTTVIVDAAPPPAKNPEAHASTGAFELTSGRRPLIVSCGSGAPFGAEWRLAGRATQSHSALSVNGSSSSRFGRGQEGMFLEDRAKVLGLQQTALEADGPLVYLAHNGWSQTHGLTALRELHLSPDGRRLSGVDILVAQSASERARFSNHLDRSKLEGIPYTIRFHLHPDVDATLDMGGNAVSMQLRSGEIWVFRFEGRGKLSLEPSVALEKGRLNPRPSLQIALSAHAREYETQISWTLAKAQDTPLAIRDLDRDDPLPI